MTSSKILAEKQRQAREVHDAYERGEITDQQRLDRLRELREPTGFWARLSWRILDL
jgi:hypothetical protein